MTTTVDVRGQTFYYRDEDIVSRKVYIDFDGKKPAVYLLYQDGKEVGTTKSSTKADAWRAAR